MNSFSTVKFKVNIANRFRFFSKSIASSHSETMEFILDFFEEQDISPIRPFSSNYHTLEKLIKKRVNGLVAIIKDIEKNQTKPMLAMMQLLFEGGAKEKKPLFIEKKVLEEKNKNEVDPKDSLLELYQTQFEKDQERINTLEEEYFVLLEQLVFTKSNFGKNHYRLDISQEELENLKIKIRKI
jgi:hypothetical protein